MPGAGRLLQRATTRGAGARRVPARVPIGRSPNAFRRSTSVLGGTYGVPRVHAELEAEGVRVGRKRVARLMRGAGLAGVSRRKGARTTQRRQEARPAPDLVDRNFTAEAPDRLWVADITYVPTWAGFFVSGRGARCVQPAHRGVVDGHTPAGRVGARRARHGAV